MNMELLVHVEKLHTSCYGAQLCLHKDFYHNSSLARTWGSNMLNKGMHRMQELPHLPFTFLAGRVEMRHFECLMFSFL